MFRWTGFVQPGMHLSCNIVICIICKDKRKLFTTDDGFSELTDCSKKNSYYPSNQLYARYVHNVVFYMILFISDIFEHCIYFVYDNDTKKNTNGHRVIAFVVI